MSETKWTPGPWDVKENKGHPGWSGFKVRAVNRNGDWTSVADTRGPVQAPGGQKANAHLIAAAPELYEALEAALPWLLTAMSHRTDAHPQAKKNHDEDVAKALRALAAARGESQP